MYSLTYSSLTRIKNVHAATHLTGSSAYRHVNNKIIPKAKYLSDLLTDGKIFKNYIHACTEANYYKVPLNPDVIRTSLLRGDFYADSIIDYRIYRDVMNRPAPRAKLIYKLNKSKIRKKISAFCRLDKTVNFVAFYSISFPSNAPDDVLYRIFNKWLTNCRTRYNLKSYIWVAERQDNNTLHFHLLTNDYMNIQSVNRSMATTINNEVNAGALSWGKSSKEKYNGVDVDSPSRPKQRQNETREKYRKRKKWLSSMNKAKVMQWMAKYMSKYVTKNDIEFNRLAYHSSRDISQLFTSKVINEDHLDNFSKYLPDDADSYFFYENKEIHCMSFKFIPDNDLFTLLDRTNQEIYNNYHNTTKDKET